MGFKVIRIDNEISCVQETGVANFMRCNIWHVKGRDYDLVIDTGMGLNSLKKWILTQTLKPIKAIGTHSHFDHSGGLHEFDCRLGHKAEADAFASGGRTKVMYRGGWSKIEIVNPTEHPDFSTKTFSITPTPLTGYLDEGDVLDLGNRTFQILHLPGHSPGSIGLYDAQSKVLFSGDAVYNGQLLDTHPHSDKLVYRATLERLHNLGAEEIHAGHEPSFGTLQLRNVISAYLAGENTMADPVTWYNENTKLGVDHYKDQVWVP
jgi:glyoxylase-like metal-dependent hydrolase (beta-lactamase superfamily II)